MSVQSQENYREYAGDGITTIFSFTFNFEANSWLAVIIYNQTTGIFTELVLDSDYTVTGAGGNSGGVVTTVVAPAVGETIIIERTRIPLTQLTVLTENDPFPAKTIEKTHDKAMMAIQQLNRISGTRAIRFPDNDTNSPVLAAAILRANKFFYFNPSGGIVYTPNTPDTYLAWDSSGVPTFLPVITGTPPDTFLQEGTGAVARNFQSKVREIFSVRDFGAVGNGIDNDTAAIQAAIDALSNTAAGGGILYFPPGDYVTDTLTLESNIIYAGAGIATILTLAVTSAGDGLFSGTSLENIQIKDFNIAASIGLSLDLEVDKIIINQCTLEGDINLEGTEISIDKCIHDGEIVINGDVVKIENTSISDNVTFKGNDFLLNKCSLTKQLMLAVDDVADVLTNIKCFKNTFTGSDAGITLNFAIATTEPLQNYDFGNNTFKECDFAFNIESLLGIAYGQNQNINIYENNIIDSGILTTNNSAQFYIRGLKFNNNKCHGNLGQFIIGQNSAANITLWDILDNKFDHLDGTVLSDLIIFNCIINEINIKGNTFSGASGLSNLGNAITLNSGSGTYLFIENNNFYNLTQTVNQEAGFTLSGNSCKYYNNANFNVTNLHNYEAWYNDDCGSIEDAWDPSTLPQEFKLTGIARTIHANQLATTDCTFAYLDRPVQYYHRSTDGYILQRYGSFTGNNWFGFLQFIPT